MSGDCLSKLSQKEVVEFGLPANFPEGLRLDESDEAVLVIAIMVPADILVKETRSLQDIVAEKGSIWVASDWMDGIEGT